MPLQDPVGGMYPLGNRIAATVIVFVVTSVIVSFVVPRTVAVLARCLDHLAERWGVQSLVNDLWEHMPPGVSFRGIVYSLQAGVITFAFLFVLSLWGRVAFIGLAIGLLLASVPSFARLLLTGVLVVGMYAGSQYVGEWVAGISDDGTYLKEHNREILTRTMQLVLLLGGTLTVLSLWEVDIDNFLLGAGVLSAVIGFGARDALGSAVSGFVLMFSRPFEVGDWVQIHDKEGQVTDVTIVNTRLRTANAQNVVLPNDEIARSEVINLSEERQLRISVEVGVAYETDLSHADEVIVDALEDMDLRSDGSAVEVSPAEFGESSIVLEVYFWIDRPHPQSRRRARAEVVRRIKTAFDSEGIEIPFPKREVAAPEEADGGSASLAVD